MLKSIRHYILLALIAGAVSARAETPQSDCVFRDVPIGFFRNFTCEEAQQGGSYRLRARVSGLSRDGFIVGNLGNVNKEKVFVQTRADTIGGQKLSVGDEVVVTGFAAWRNRRPFLTAGSVSVVGHQDEVALQSLRVKELNRGQYDLRRIAIAGEVVSVECYEEEGAVVSLLTLSEQNRHYLVRVLGDCSEVSVEPGCRVRGIGSVRNEYDANDHLLSVVIEVSDPTSLEVLGFTWTRFLRWTLWIIGTLTLAAAIVFLCLWIKARRERQILACLTNERIRLADELHDTVEQYVAGACLFLSGGSVDEAIRVLDEAKKNVGEVLDRLRGRRDAE